MPFNGSGVFVRTQNWTNDANNNLPISATKFDQEDSDFASGLSLCLTRDGQGKPSGPLTWSQALTIAVAGDGLAGAWGRVGGANNPQLQANVADATGVTLNLSTAQALAFAIQNTNVMSIAAGGVTLLQPLILQNGTAVNPTLTFAASASSGLYSVGASDLGIAIAGAQAVDIQANQLAAVGAAGVAASLVVAGNGIAISSGLAMSMSAAGLARFLLAGTEIANINANRVWTFDAPASGSHGFSGAAGGNALQANGSSTSGQSFGFRVIAGTTSADWCARFDNQANTQNYLDIQGDGQVYVGQPTAASAGPANTFQVGYLDAPQNLQNGSYTLALTDRGKSIVHASGAGNTYTIPANASVAFPLGTTIVVANVAGSPAMSLAITTDALVWAPSGTTGTRTLTSPAVATLFKYAATAWLVTGVGIT